MPHKNAKSVVRKTYRRDTSEVSCCLKYVIFSVNVLFWVRNLAPGFIDGFSANSQHFICLNSCLVFAF